MKNSSRFALVMDRNLSRSSSGTDGSVASSNTRRLNSRQLNSRLRNRRRVLSIGHQPLGRFRIADHGFHPKDLLEQVALFLQREAFDCQIRAVTERNDELSGLTRERHRARLL